jgi:hypothetical protein
LVRLVRVLQVNPLRVQLVVYLFLMQLCLMELQGELLQVVAAVAEVTFPLLESLVVRVVVLHNLQFLVMVFQAKVMLVEQEKPPLNMAEAEAVEQGQLG